MATRMPRMTARQTLEREPNSSRRTMPFERFQRICRAAGVEATMHAEHRANAVAISPDKDRQQFTHDDFARQRSISVSGTVFAVIRITMSRLPSRACWSRNSSRNTRFIRLRSTARGKTRLGTMRPSLGTPRAFVPNKTLNPERLRARPPASNAVMSAVPSRCLRLKRLCSLKRSNERALWRAARESQLVPPVFAYEQETRGCAFDE